MSTAAERDDDSAAMLTVARGLQVLRAFRSERAPLTNAELVRRTGLPKASVSRLTSTLLQLGFLNHVAGSREFELSTGPLSLGHAFLEANELLQKVQLPMQQLADRLGVSAALAVPNGLDMLYVAYRASARVATLRLGVGSVLPMGMTAIGRAYLWALPASERDALTERINCHLDTAQAIVVERGIRDSFAELDATGTCCVSDGYLRDTFGIALPVRFGAQGRLMSMSCGSAVVRPDLAREHNRIAPVLKDAAAELQDLLTDDASLV